MVEYFSLNQDTFWFMVGFGLLILEATAFGFTTGVLLFSAIGALVTGSLNWLGLLPDNWMIAIGCFAISSALSAILLWKPFLRLQNNKELPKHETSSDLIGHSFRLTQKISRSQLGQTAYSGIQWRVELDDQCPVDEIAEGKKVEVSAVSVGVFYVKPVEELSHSEGNT